MSLFLQDKVIVVVGGLGLLGREFVKAVVENGATGIIADINEASGLEFRNEILDGCRPGKVNFMHLDITSKESLARFLDWAFTTYGRIDAVVNSAYPRNPNYGRKFEDVTYQDFCDNVGLHLGGYFLTSQQFALAFKIQGFGNVVNMASIYGVVPPHFEVYEGTPMTMPVEYAAIKSGIIHLTKYLAKYFKGCNIRFNCISPGGILDRQPQKFLDQYQAFCSSKGMLERDDITGTLVFLLSDFSKYINGQNIIVDDGFSL